MNLGRGWMLLVLLPGLSLHVGCDSSEEHQAMQRAMDAENEQRAVEAFSRGLAYLNKGELDKAIADCTAAIRLDPDDGETYHHRGLAHQARGDRAKADADFAKARELGHQPE